jgi:hypothetical protein
MTYTFKLARRLAALRSAALVSGLLLGAACAEDTTTAPRDDSSITPTSVPPNSSNQTDPMSSLALSSTVSLRKIVLAPANITVNTGGTVHYRWFGWTMTWDSIPVTVTLTATGGTITSSGLYTAGKSPGTYHVIAKSGVYADTSIVVLTGTSTSETSQTPTPVSEPALTPPPTPVGAGVPLGPFHLPNDQFGVRYWYNGALRALTPWSAERDLSYAKSKGIRMVVSLAGSRGTYTNSDQTFNLSMWKQRMDVWRPQAALLQTYRSNGTIIANYLVDEPNCSGCWGGKPITGAEIAEMGRYAKSILPGIPTVVRAVPAWLRNAGLDGSKIDVAWAQYSGPLHTPSLRMTPQEFRDKNVADAKSMGVGLILGMNTLDGGDGSSGIAGTYDLRTVSNRWQMSAKEVEQAGSVFAAEPYVCAVLDWRYSPTITSSGYTAAQAAGIRAFDDRSDVKAALARVLQVAKARTATSCQ